MAVAMPSKDSAVVEYALSQTLSPALVAQYQTQVPNKQMLAAKLLDSMSSTCQSPLRRTTPAGAPRTMAIDGNR